MVINADKLLKFYGNVEAFLLGKNIRDFGMVKSQLTWLQRTIPRETGIGLMPNELRQFKVISQACSIPLDIFEQE